MIGSGPGGHGAAIQAAKLGKRVAAIEMLQSVGGNTVNTGTIPSKTLREAVMYLTGYLQRGMYGLSYAVKENITFQGLTYRCQQVIEDRVHVLGTQFGRNKAYFDVRGSAFGSAASTENRGRHRAPLRTLRWCR